MSQARIEHNVVVGDGVVIWDGTHVRSGVSIGFGTSVGEYCYVGPNVSIGSNCKIQNQVLIYEPAVIHDGVFIGPGVVITNDLNPRAINIDGDLKSSSDWVAVSAEIFKGASLGAGVICVGPIKIGSWSMIADGSVVTKDVLDFEIVAGVPAKHIGWVGEAGFRLDEVEPGVFLCPQSQRVYRLDTSGKMFLDLI
jgi:acetyltransferase-like isoleucine patch superfamily enzyme